MRLYLPYSDKFRRYLGSDTEIVFYAANRDLPEVCGGRIAKTVLSSTPEMKDMIHLSEEFGPNFRLLANSTFPKITQKLKEVCHILAANESGLVAAQMEFAQMVKDYSQDLTLGASCIMCFYTPFLEILESPIFSGVCGPQFWNFDTEKMVSEVPEEHRSRVYYILNSCCKWDDDCKNHYEDMSKSYVNKGENWKSKHKLPLLEKNDWKLAMRSVEVRDRLQENGFSSFKIQGRDLPPVRALYQVDSLLGLADAGDMYRRSTGELA